MKTTRKYTMGARAQAVEETRQPDPATRTIALAGERPFAEITLDAVAERAGVSVQTVLRQFGSRDGLIEEGAEVATAEIMEERRTPAGDVAAAMRDLADHYERLGQTALLMLAQEGHDDRGPQGHRPRQGHAPRSGSSEVFAPVDRADERVLDLLVVATDVYTWKLLRHRPRPLPRRHRTADARPGRRRPGVGHHQLHTRRSEHGRDPLRHLGRRRQRASCRRHRQRAAAARPRRPVRSGTPGSTTPLTAAGFDVAAVRERPAPSRPLDDNSPLTYVKIFDDRGLGRDVMAALADRAADVVVVDCMLFGVMEALAPSPDRRTSSLEHLYDALLPPVLAPWADGPGHAGAAARCAVASLARRRVTPGGQPAGPRPGRCAATARRDLRGSGGARSPLARPRTPQSW